ncbi:diguanylate cyclase (plasmid) [Deinococcus psychrotolerans]|uniref:Diguanylate cyclase n=1 Tax=Deinococcus psychrotolerans TaxID=2489213 RepID=A0A3G8YK80_9DEIO|nr:HD domain-containing phosphohydrolase [Deinococcus psychrotolerans]AZI44697.1 diguanylate cyclase [Deinococcus psychrotolerans]
MTFSMLLSLTDSLFFALILFPSFAILVSLSFSAEQNWKTKVFRGLVYLGAGLACLMHTHTFAPGFYLDFREVPVALASSFMGTPWGVLIGAALSLYHWLILGQQGAAIASLQLASVVGIAALLRRSKIKIGQSLKQRAVYAALLFVPSSAVLLLNFVRAPQAFSVAAELYIIKVVFSITGFCLWAALVSLARQTVVSNRRYQRLATRDALTGLHNRYAFEEDQPPLSPNHPEARFLLLLDLDHFKRVNDEHGHLYGDQVLKQFSKVLSAHLNERSRAYRVGGEEFAVRLSVKHAEAQHTVQAFTQQLQAALAEVQRKHFSSLNFALTVSGGLVAEGEQAFQRADELLYLAKGAGRNQILAEWQPRPEALPPSPFNDASPGAATIRSLLRFLAEQGSDEPDLPGLLRAAILCVPGAEAGSLSVRDGEEWVVRGEVGYGEALLGVRYTFSQMQNWHGDLKQLQQGQPRLLTGEALQLHSQRDVEPPDIPASVRRIQEIKANLLLPIVVQGKVVAELNLDNLHDPAAFGSTSLELAKEFALWAAAVMAAHERRHQHQADQESALLMLGLALETRDGATQGHTRRVVELSSALGQHLALSDEQLGALRQGAYLHDLGKLQVADRVLLKSGPFDAEEEALMQRHVELGTQLAEHFPNVSPDACKIIEFHHERWDGAGYPRGVSGKDIPLLARIFAVADVYDALVSERPYKAEWTPEAAIWEIVAQRGVQFDPEVVDAFVELMDDPHSREPSHWAAPDTAQPHS